MGKRNQFFVCESLTIDSNFENDYFSSSALLFYVPYSVYVIYPLEINKLRFRYTDNEGRNVVGGRKMRKFSLFVKDSFTVYLIYYYAFSII